MIVLKAKTLTLFSVFILIIITSILIYLKITPQNPNPKLTINNTTIQVEIKDTPKTRKQGLSNRKHLPKDQGVLFIFDQPAQHSFWMKDMLFNLDFIWIKDNKVIDLTENVPAPKNNQPPVSLKPKSPVNKVLEVNAGFIQKHHIKINDLVKLTN